MELQAPVETITEQVKAKPVREHKIVPIRQVEVGDLIYFHEAGVGPFRVETLRDNGNTGSAHKVVTASSFSTKVETWNDPTDMPHVLTGEWQTVELWESDGVREAFGLEKVAPRPVEMTILCTEVDVAANKAVKYGAK